MHAFDELHRLRTAQEQRFRDTSGLSLSRIRWRERLATQFVGQPLPRKLRFVRLLGEFAAKRVARRARSLRHMPNVDLRRARKRTAPVAFHIPGAIGDLVNALPFVHAFAERLAGARVDIFYKVPEHARAVFHGAPWLGEVYDADLLSQTQQDYAIAGMIADIVRYWHVDRARLACEYPQLLPLLETAEERCRELGLLVDCAVSASRNACRPFFRTRSRALRVRRSRAYDDDCDFR